MLIECFTGRLRPRHHQFSKALGELLLPSELTRLGYPTPRFIDRLKINLQTRTSGVRSIKQSFSQPSILHQAVFSKPSAPYFCEWDVPLGLFGYNEKRNKNQIDKATRLLEKEELKKILVFSNWAKRSFRLHFGEKVYEKCELVYPLSSLEYGRVNFEAKNIDFIFVSKQFRIKGGVEAAHAVQKLALERPDLKTVFITDLQEAEFYLGDLGKFSNIQWINASLDASEVGNWLVKSRCLLMPSMFDSFGVVVLEALAAGCAVISTNIASFPELVEEGINGFLFSPPVSVVSQDDFIYPYKTNKKFSKLLDSLNLESLHEQIYLRMHWFLENETTALSLMKGSLDLYNKRFSRASWKLKMKSLLRHHLNIKGFTDES